MSKKIPLKDIEILRRQRKIAQKKAQAEKLDLKKQSQERREALVKERVLRNTTAQIKKNKPSKKNTEQPKQIDVKKALKAIKSDAPVSIYDLANLIGYNMEDKSTDAGKQERAEFGSLLNHMVDTGLIKEKKWQIRLRE